MKLNLRKMVRGVESDDYAKELIKFWKYDEGTLELWRASSNFVYSFEYNNVQYFLRISLDQDNSIEEIKAELDFMKYLRLNGFSCLMYAVYLEDSDMVTYLLNKGADINLKSTDINPEMDKIFTAMDIALWKDNISIYNKLLESYICR